MEEVTTAVQEAVATAVQEAAIQTVETAKKGVMDQAVSVIKSNRKLIMWTMVFTCVAVGGIYIYNKNKEQVIPVANNEGSEETTEPEK